jgi:hypothetical protein
MADETADPRDATAGMPAQRCLETSPGSLDMSEWERVFSGPATRGPVLRWTVVHPDGRTYILDSEDDALLLARNDPGCRMTRRYAGPWLPEPLA